jgi:hypothetical protein
MIIKRIKFVILISMTIILTALQSHWGQPALSLPPPSDIPEEVLRTQIITAARSPIDGKPMNAAEYAELQAQLQVSPPRKLNTRIREQVFLLRVRKALQQLFPFLNF